MIYLLDRASELEQRHREDGVKAVLTKAKDAQNIDADGNHYCVDCGEKIPAGRLIALPHAVCCIDCQSIREHERNNLCSKR